MIRLSDVPTGSGFTLDGVIYKLLKHDYSGSLSGGPGCEREYDGEVVYFSYIAWEKDAKATMVELVIN